ncbi:hypothetical protein KUCAC02_013159 [Chaenocephalus aceratus]|uniref:Uncharacterized protein n=1 Tax=Chaenocephalus aceratus TaxID=36190 RepID=A0ACB9XCQ7_CHAAC|nr:hypothetical protein KUCAC02_013159 [Chaenocephalus aceratus]
MCFTYEQKQKYNILHNSLFISVYKAQHIITFHNTFCCIAICTRQSGCASLENVSEMLGEEYMLNKCYPGMYYETFDKPFSLCFVKNEQKSLHFHSIFELSRYVLFLYIYLKNISQSQKSPEEYFSSPFRCIHSIYIHSPAQI